MSLLLLMVVLVTFPLRDLSGSSINFRFIAGDMDAISVTILSKSIVKHGIYSVRVGTISNSQVYKSHILIFISLRHVLLYYTILKIYLLLPMVL